MNPKYPNIRVSLEDVVSDAIAMSNRVAEALQSAGVSADEIAIFQKETQIKNYTRAAATCMRWVSIDISDEEEERIVRDLANAAQEDDWVDAVNAARSGDLFPAVYQLLGLLAKKRVSLSVVDPFGLGDAARKDMRLALEELLRLGRDDMPPQALAALTNLKRGAKRANGGCPPKYLSAADQLFGKQPFRQRVQTVLTFKRLMVDEARRRGKAAKGYHNTAVRLAVEAVYGILPESVMEDRAAQLEKDLRYKKRLGAAVLLVDTCG